MQYFTGVFIIFIFTLASTISSPSFAAPATSKRKLLKIAIVHSYHRGFVWTDDVESGFLKSMEKEFQVQVVKRFYLDAKLHPELISQKGAEALDALRSTNFDLLFITDDDAMKEVGIHFKNTDRYLIFAGINELLSTYGIGKVGVADLDQVLPEKWAGVLEYYPVAPLLSLIRQLHPKATTLNLFFDESVTGQAVRVRFQQEFTSAEAKKFGFHVGSTVVSDKAEDWDMRLASSNPKISVNLIFPFSNIKFNQAGSKIAFTSSLDKAKWLVSKSRTPEYATASLTMKFPFFAAVGIRGIEHGEDAANTAIALIKGSSGQKLSIAKYARLNLNSDRATELGIKIPFEFMAYSYSLRSSEQAVKNEKRRD